ncbi:MAG: trehalose-6-phosphate synthase [Acidobacteria bacterium]|nr:MAG: trehalose-6-phosphate synthase [Acidobacteriota bacterium]PYY22545.1 MAG: trehalose-6-phosphate synthase [Acidobacteriota bacterium]
MRLSFRLICALVVVLTLVSLLFAYAQFKGERRGLEQDLQRRAQILADSLQESVEPVLEKRSRRSLQQLVERFGNREHLAGIAIYDQQDVPIAITSALRKRFLDDAFAASKIKTYSRNAREFLWLNSTYLNVHTVPLNTEQGPAGTLVVVHDAGYINAQNSRFWKRVSLRVVVEVILIGITALLIIRWTIEGPAARTLQWIRASRAGKVSSPPALPDGDLFMPLRNEVTTLVQSLAAARESAEKEARLREAGESTWTAERLAVHVRSKLNSSRLFVVSNREPYMHSREGKSLKVLIPASGLVTALEPILRACDGTWIAHGSGDADRETVDRNDRLAVPPDEPKYTLRRVWLNKDEEEGYYYGFANEGLWPLCHIAHTRPLFRAQDWKHYEQVNRKFAEAVLDEMAGTKQPALLIQDYHFALLPKMIKKERPDARVAIFWHIPWPNPEAFGICPWQRELLDGLLAADLVGFHIQSHCDNFLETVNRSLESRVEWEHFSVNREDHVTAVKPFPISVAPNMENAKQPQDWRAASAEREALLKELGVDALYLGVGVDRVDYTKGILERFLAVERFLERYPRYEGKFTFIQIGAPSRTHIRRYHEFLAEVEAEAERINWRFRSNNWKPIVFRKRHHSHEEISRFYRAADLCLVTSLHDGMNLVAKEFVSSREDESGVLMLSRFTGASRELRDALVVNPYDTEEMSEAIHYGLEMDSKERRARMQRMRQTVREQNIYRWAGTLIAELCQVRLDTGGKEKKGRANANTAA